MTLPAPEVLVALVIGASLNAYALMGGADFGGGLWDLLARGPRRERQRALIAEAIAPIWEANHVWLILVIVLLFTCFPPVFAELSIVLHVPLTLMLIGIVFRGSAFTFRSYGRHGPRAGVRWGTVFAVASLVTPLLLGVCVGAVASGAVGRSAAGGFSARFVEPWAAAFPALVGVTTLALFAFLAAVYLTIEAPDEALREDFRTRALAAAGALFASAWLALLVGGASDALVARRLLGGPWAVPFHVATGGAATAAIWLLWRRRYREARLLAGLQASLILWGWLAAQYPYLIPPTTTLADAAAPAVTLRLVLAGLAVGFAVLLPSLYYLFRVFRKVGGAPPPT